MRLMQLNQLNEEAIKTLRPSFDNLPHTNHKDGKYRLRRYSKIELRTTHWGAGEQIDITHLSESEFTQSSDYNSHQGGAVRKFQNLEESTVKSVGFEEMCLAFKKENQFFLAQPPFKFFISIKFFSILFYFDKLISKIAFWS